MMSVTHGAAKELLPLGGSTVIEHILDEAFRVCEHAIVVWDINKGELPDGVAWVPQMPQRGLAPAIASGVSTEEDNLIMLPDAYFYPVDPAQQMASMGRVDIILALSKVSDEEVSKYGICEVDDNGWVTKMLEKPSSEETQSRWAITGRYRLSPKAAELLIEYVTTAPLDQTEIDMSGYFALAIEKEMGISCCFLDSSHKRFDCGDPEGYQAAVEAFGQ
jgi:UTP-glucose-1-phosphate uridylyltransferase